MVIFFSGKLSESSCLWVERKNAKWIAYYATKRLTKKLIKDLKSNAISINYKIGVKLNRFCIIPQPTSDIHKNKDNWCSKNLEKISNKSVGKSSKISKFLVNLKKF